MKFSIILVFRLSLFGVWDLQKGIIMDEMPIKANSHYKIPLILKPDKVKKNKTNPTSIFTQS